MSESMPRRGGRSHRTRWPSYLARKVETRARLFRIVNPGTGPARILRPLTCPFACVRWHQHAANAQRLTSMAWLLFGVHVAYGLPQLATINVARVTVNGYSSYKQSFKFDALDLTGILMVLTLFILARVFRQGAALREDLEGTV
jgi:hypothetical protein